MRVFDALNASLLTPGKFFVEQSVTQKTTPLKTGSAPKHENREWGCPEGPLRAPPRCAYLWALKEVIIS